MIFCYLCVQQCRALLVVSMTPNKRVAVDHVTTVNSLLGKLRCEHMVEVSCSVALVW